MCLHTNIYATIKVPRHTHAYNTHTHRHTQHIIHTHTHTHTYTEIQTMKKTKWLNKKIGRRSQDGGGVGWGEQIGRAHV